MDFSSYHYMLKAACLTRGSTFPQPLENPQPSVVMNLIYQIQYKK